MRVHSSALFSSAGSARKLLRPTCCFEAGWSQPDGLSRFDVTEAAELADLPRMTPRVEALAE